MQVHPDPGSMDVHLQVAGDKILAAFAVVDNDSVDVYGTPAQVTRGLLGQIGLAGVRVSVNSNRPGGFAAA